MGLATATLSEVIVPGLAYAFGFGVGFTFGLLAKETSKEWRMRRKIKRYYKEERR